ncbi:MAG: hypothetical protein NT125_05990 [Candidatus Bipolaricaulota bacterium]|nr:hypothetical protein [Candidatus Bipolaricaulota bacterium]
MRTGACILLASGTTALAASAFLAGQDALGLSAVFLGLLWTLIAASDVSQRVLTVILVLFMALCAVTTLAGGMPHLLTAAAVLGLFGWDGALAARTISPFPIADRRRFAGRHSLETLALGGVSFGLAALGLEAPLRLGFSATLALGLLSVLILGVGVRATLAPPMRRRHKGLRHPLRRRPTRLR